MFHTYTVPSNLLDVMDGLLSCLCFIYFLRAKRNYFCILLCGLLRITYIDAWQEFTRIQTDMLRALCMQTKNAWMCFNSSQNLSHIRRWHVWKRPLNRHLMVNNSTNKKSFLISSFFPFFYKHCQLTHNQRTTINSSKFLNDFPYLN